MNFYAYLHARPNTEDASGIFYVGKGHGGRAWDFARRRNRYHSCVADKHGLKNILVGSIPCSDEKTSLELERGLIKCLKRMGVCLTNMTDGGDGVSGYKHTAEWKMHHSSIMRGKPSPTKGRVMPDEQKAKISASLIKLALWKGKKHTKEARAKIGAVNKNTVWITNGIFRKRVFEHEVPLYASFGFVKGIKL